MVKLIPEPASVITPSRPLIVKLLQTLGEVVIATVNALVPKLELASKNTLSAAVGTDAPIVAALMSCDARVPLALVVHELPLPPVIVPILLPELLNTVIPTTNAGEPVVVKAVPVRLPVNDFPEAADHFAVLAEVQLPEPPTQYLSAMFIPQYQACATQRHLPVATFQTNPMSKRLVETVVVGNATVDASKFEVLKVKPTAAVPVIESHNFCPLVGVPVVVMDVMVAV